MQEDNEVKEAEKPAVDENSTSGVGQTEAEPNSEPKPAPEGD